MSDNIIFANNASALLAATITAGSTTIQVASGFGALFPSPSSPDVCYLTLVDDSGNIEVVKCTARTGDNLTVVRAQDGTTARAFTQNVTRVELRLTKVVMEEFLQKNGGTMTGDVDFNGNGIVDAVLSGPLTKITNGEIYNVPLRGATGQSSNEIAVPASGRATVGGAEILAKGDDIVAELDTAGVIIFDSATIGVRIPAGAYLRVEGTSAAEYFEVTHDDTDVNFAFGNAAALNIPIQLDMGADIDLVNNQLKQADFIDFQMTVQTVAAAATTAVNYTLGSYVKLTMGTNISSFSITNPPASNKLGVVRLKVIQDATGGRTITWPASFKWPDGVAPTLSTAANAYDYIDLWTDDGGATWNGAYNTNWS